MSRSVQTSSGNLETGERYIWAVGQKAPHGVPSSLSPARHPRINAGTVRGHQKFKIIDRL